VSERLIEYPDGKRVSFDVLGMGTGLSVFVFPIDLRTGTTTLVREYSPGQHRVMHGFPAGLWEGHKHLTMEDAARAELSEEAQLRVGRLERLTGHHGIAADKYSRNVFHFFVRRVRLFFVVLCLFFVVFKYHEICSCVWIFPNPLVLALTHFTVLSLSLCLSLPLSCLSRSRVFSLFRDSIPIHVVSLGSTAFQTPILGTRTTRNGSRSFGTCNCAMFVASSLGVN
jgi:8-oxo-dGTP pyrophosphatase MutT (NUDIX family)